jgi:hypothetical protein
LTRLNRPAREREDLLANVSYVSSARSSVSSEGSIE